MAKGRKNSERRSSSSQGHGDFAGYLTYLFLRWFVESDTFRQAVSGLGTAGRTFFTLGMLTLAVSFLIVEPGVFAVMAGIGAGSMAIGLLFGLANMMRTQKAEARAMEQLNAVEPGDLSPAERRQSAPTPSSAFAPPPVSPGYQSGSNSMPSAYFQPPKPSDQDGVSEASAPGVDGKENPPPYNPGYVGV